MPLQVVHRLLARRPSGAVSPCAATRPMWSSGRGLQPDRGAVRQQQVEGGRVRHDAAGRRDHGLAVDLDCLLEGAPLVAAVGVRCRRGRGSRDAAAGELLDLAAQLDEGDIQVVGQHLPQRGLAGAAQADQRDPAGRAAVAGRRAQQLAEGDARTRRSVGLVAVLQQFADQQPFGRERSSRRRAARPASTAAPSRPAAAPGSRRCRRRAPDWPRWRSDTSAAGGERLARHAPARCAGCARARRAPRATDAWPPRPACRVGERGQHRVVGSLVHESLSLRRRSRSGLTRIMHYTA